MLVLYRNCWRSLCSSVSAVPSDDDDSSSLPPQLPPFDYQPKPYVGPSAEQGKCNTCFSDSLDAFAGIVTVSCGHYYVNAITEQNNLPQHATTIYLHHAIADFAEALASKMPGNLKIHTVESLARMRPFMPKAKDVQDQIVFGSSGKVAGFIAETIQGVGGAVELAPGYLKHVYDIVHKAGGVCIADEVQTGFGRTGSHYWGFQTQGVIPNIVTMAKGIGNGLPLGAVVTTPEIASVMAQKIQFNTFGGNPVCSAGGLAVLRVIDKEKCQAHCADVGSHLIGRLRALEERHDSFHAFGDVWQNHRLASHHHIEMMV
ncbi:hypothetical protein Patl1_27412 [Pistacia atlantica]|uniref:Uncharacterized protein n=1 Tax=Pistacia atlantica TaxID=434234 RepID=A0ACC1BD10_9ROSI|nr:hypothetical protein Patl1_27412 [Pistacia atlantica]